MRQQACTEDPHLCRLMLGRERKRTVSLASLTIQTPATFRYHNLARTAKYLFSVFIFRRISPGEAPGPHYSM
jgi:hypothetical protein